MPLSRAQNYFKVELIIEFEPGLDNFQEQLMEMKNAQARVYLMYASQTDAVVIFRDAALLNMTDAGYAWIVTEQALEAENVPKGTLGLELVNATDENAHIRDSIPRANWLYLGTGISNVYIGNNTGVIFFYKHQNTFFTLTSISPTKLAEFGDK
ncbi:hypothetical protein NQ317_010881 [Molorchus minor]|uniref:Receptor ligand binding region domain-containing protein n=1 Tax=Molorchus minor TaxID=1323400 RepID=A0ABQ9JCM9_9CUCU|nr:hypothetical protein NQ317_010881 [Molorchus minor]